MGHMQIGRSFYSDASVTQYAVSVVRMGHDDEKLWSSAVAETIRAERAAARLSQAELAARAGMPRVTYIRYESGVRRPTIVQVMQIAQALGISFQTFAHRIEDRIAQGKEVKAVSVGRDRDERNAG